MEENFVTSDAGLITHNASEEQTTQHSGPTVTSEWIAVATVSLACLLISFYIFTALVVHECKQKRNLGADLRTISNQGHRGSQRLQYLILAGAILVTLRITSELTHLHLGSHSDSLCNVLVKIQIMLYALPIAAIYGFLWARQRILYIHPNMKLFSTKPVRVMSWSIIISMVVGEATTGVMFLATRTYSKSSFGCSIKETTIPGTIPWLILLGVTIFFQSLLLALFVIPLTRHRRMVKSVQSDSHIEDNLKPVIQRVLVTTVVCVISDVVAALVTLATNTILISNVVYDTNLLINMLGICMSFSDWRDRLFPFCINTKGDSHRKDIVVVVTQPQLSGGMISTQLSDVGNES